MHEVKKFFIPEPRVFAHRGLSCEYPENTEISFRKAVESGADVIETDVHLTRDKKFVVIHDPDLKRLCGVNRKVCEMTLDEIQRHDSGHSFTTDRGTTYPFRDRGHTFMDLNGLFESFPEQRFNIELKDNDPSQVDGYLELLRRHGAEEKVLTASQHRSNIRMVRKKMPGLATSFAMWEVIGMFSLFKTGFLFTKKSFSADALQIPEFYGTSRIVSPSFIRQAHDRGIRVHVWTINEEKDIRRLFDWGADGVMSDDFRIIQRVLG